MLYKRNCDRWLLSIVSAMTLFGLLMAYSASFVEDSREGVPSYFLHHCGCAAVGYILMILVMTIDYHLWLKLRTLAQLSIVSVIILLFALTQPHGITGAHRMIRISPSISIKPSEIAGLVVLFVLARFLEKNRNELKQPSSQILPCLILIAGVALLIALEPDFGQALFICILAALLFFIAGLRWTYIWLAVLSLLPAFLLMIWHVPYRRAHMLSWLTSPQDSWPFMAAGLGGLLGVGFGAGRQKFLFPSGNVLDFIYAVIWEELGLIGAVLVVAAFLFVLWRGVRISLGAKDAGGCYLALGITLMITLKAFSSISGVLDLLPTKGVALPFVGQTGSSLVVTLIATGILLNISAQKKAPDDQQHP